MEESQYIGGISRTHIHNENRMDLGGHRFFTKSEEVLNLMDKNVKLTMHNDVESLNVMVAGSIIMYELKK